jgi:predicted transcriptional regulator
MIERNGESTRSAAISAARLTVFVIKSLNYVAKHGSRQETDIRQFVITSALQMQRIGVAMKTASLPSLRVDPELRRAAESVLNDGESLSSLMESSLRSSVIRRQLQRDFVARGLASREEARRTGDYYAADDVHAELEVMLAAFKKGQGAR